MGSGDRWREKEGPTKKMQMSAGTQGTREHGDRLDGTEGFIWVVVAKSFGENHQGQTV